MIVCRRLCVVLLGLVLAGCAAGAFAADNTRRIVIFKDGFAIHGEKVEEDKEYVLEGHTPIMIPKGTFALDARARIYSFPARRVAEVLKKDAPLSEMFAWPAAGRIGHRLDSGVNPVVAPEVVNPFNAHWDRDIRLATGPKLFRQRLMILTPSYSMIEALDWNWRAFYLTSELGAENVLQLIRTHPKAIKIGAGNKPDSQAFAIYRFLVEAGWYDEAGRQLDAILKKFPDKKRQVAEQRQSLKRLEASRLYEDLVIAYGAGQHTLVQKTLTNFPTGDLEAGSKTLTTIRSLQTKYEAAKESLGRAGRLMQALVGKVTAPADRALFRDVVAAIRAEMSLDDFLPDATPEKLKIGRLEPFLGLAAQYERELKQRKTSTQTPEELLALAVNGWLLGREGAEIKTDTARRLWEARLFLLSYLHTDNAESRTTMLQSYMGRKGKYAAADEAAQMLKLLPPTEAEEKPPQTATELEAHYASRARRALSYVLQLPPEYHPGRNYPVLIALHQAGERPAAMLERCGALANKYGFILAAPAWSRVFDELYGYTPAEHAAVLDLLVDLRRRFAVDSDRVFLLGYGEGGTMAYDVGLAHPDVFAGILPVAGQPAKFALAYAPNAQYLPLYAVDGENSGKGIVQNLRQFRRWVRRDFPVLHVIYRGRGLEWFPGELPDMFAWMALQHRASSGSRAGAQLGDSDNQFQMLRPADNHFYWLSAPQIDKRHLVDPDRWDARRSPATLEGRVGQSNEVVVKCRGVRDITVWLGRDMLIDFDRPVRVLVNAVPRFHGKVKPSLSTLLEDYYERGDRQSLFLARVDIKRADR